MKLTYLLIFLFFTGPAFAGVEQLPEPEFRKLAADLAPKVNLFRDVWQADPSAQFYGGTSRDFLYWIKGNFKEARSPADAQRIAAGLRKLSNIDVRDFIIGDSDVDVIAKRAPAVDVANYGIKKLDAIPSDILDETTVRGQTEIHQGYIPAEKVRIAADGVHTSPSLGDGVREIYDGKLSVHFAPPELFEKTHYAAQKLNHPVLLATRYLRLQAINYFKSHGAGYPDRAKLLDAIPKDAMAAVEGVISRTLDGRELQPYMSQPQFKKWLNGNIQKAFRSYTNPTAALELMHLFKVDQLVGKYDGLEPLNNYVFAKYRDPAVVAANFAKAGVKPESIYVPVAHEFPDSVLYHGTKEEKDFRAILLQGILPSSGGSADKGLYGVALPDRTFAESWGGDKDRLIGFPVKQNAKIIDITQGPGHELFKKFGGRLDDFAEAFGADIIRYPYSPNAYVVKNSDALARGHGVHREVVSFSRALEAAEKVKTMEDLQRLKSNLELSRFSAEEIADLFRGSPNIAALPLFEPVALSDSLLRLSPVSEEDSAFGIGLKQAFGPGELKKLRLEVKSSDDFYRWLGLFHSLYAKELPEEKYGGMSVTNPAVSRAAQPRGSITGAEEILTVIREGEAAGLIGPNHPPRDYAALKLLSDLADQWEGFPLGGELLKLIAGYRSNLSAPEAERRAMAVLKNDLFFARPEKVRTQLVSLAASSSLPDAEKTKLIRSLLEAGPFDEEKHLGTKVGLKEKQIRALSSYPAMEIFFRSPALRDYPDLALEAIRAKDFVQLKGYSTIYGSSQMGILVTKLRRAARELDDGAFIAKAFEAAPNWTDEDWNDVMLNSPYYDEGRRLDSVLRDALPAQFRFPDKAYDMKMSSPPNKYSSVRELDFKVAYDLLMGDPRFSTHAMAPEYLKAILDIPAFTSGQEFYSRFPKLLPVMEETIKHADSAYASAIRKRVLDLAPIEMRAEIKERLRNDGHPRGAVTDSAGLSRAEKPACSGWFLKIFGR